MNITAAADAVGVDSVGKDAEAILWEIIEKYKDAQREILYWQHHYEKVAKERTELLTKVSAILK